MCSYFLLEKFWIRREDARSPPEITVQKFPATSHKLIKIQRFKTEKYLKLNVIP